METDTPETVEARTLASFADSVYGGREPALVSLLVSNNRQHEWRVHSGYANIFAARTMYARAQKLLAGRVVHGVRLLARIDRHHYKIVKEERA